MGKQKSIMLLVTYKCNLHCSYCYEHKISNFHMTVDKAKQVIQNQLAHLSDEFDSVEIQFMGGEPLLEYSLIKEVSEWLWSLQMNQQLMVLFAPTNGTLLNDEMKSWFYANRNRIHLGLSFDGDNSMQDTNRSASSNRVDLEFFAKTWPEQSIKMTISPETVELLSEGVAFLHSKGFKYISADLAMGDRLQWTRSSLQKFQSELRKLCNYYMENPKLIPFSMLRLDINSVCKKSMAGVKTCSCGEDMICVDWSGESYACHLFSPIALPLNKARRSNIVYDFSDYSQFNGEKCSRCALNNVCNHCYGMNYLCTGDVTQPSPFHCSAMKIIFAANCRFRLALAEQKTDLKQVNAIINVINRVS